MNPPPPPPPPPHGASPRSGGLPPGNYDIFVIPPHSSGSGFLYLPSLQTHRNSFLAGAACTVVVVFVWQVVTPVLKNWLATIMASGGPGVIMLILGVGIAGWAWGKTQIESDGMGSGKGGQSGAAPRATGGAAGSATGAAGPAGSNATGTGTGTNPGEGPRPKPTWQRADTTGPTSNASPGTGTATGAWEKAREEIRRKEEERKKKEETDRKAKDSVWERAKAREKEARERAEREKSKETTSARAGSASTPSSARKHQQPTARTYLGTEDEEYSFRPYDKPRSKPLRKEHSHSSIYSESSYAPSQSTSRTTPPPSHRGPYSTKDPDKIVIKAVYSFANTFAKSPTAQLISGVGSVTDGLILRITTEGLFIDDDVRGVPQREWDVKAWTMKLVEVWCPDQIQQQRKNLGASSGSSPNMHHHHHHPHPPGVRQLFALGAKAAASAALASSVGDADQLLHSLLASCKANCFHAPPTTSSFPASTPHQRTESNLSPSSASVQSGDYRELHALRASIRDQDGRRYVFVLDKTEGWKVAVGLQRLRRGTQVRALAVSSMSVQESQGLLEALGWGS